MYRGHSRYIYTAKAHACDTWADRLRFRLWRMLNRGKPREGYGRISQIDTYGTWAAGWQPAAIPPLRIMPAHASMKPYQESRTRIRYDL